MWKCALDLSSVFIPTSQVQLLSSTAFIELHHKFTNSRQCKVLWSAFWAMMFGCALILRMKPIRHWWQAVNFHCTWPAYYLDFRLRVSLEFDNYFRPQIMCYLRDVFGHPSKASNGDIYGTIQGRQRRVPQFFLFMLWKFLISCEQFGGKKKSVYHQSSLSCASLDSWNLLLGLSVCLSVFVENKHEKQKNQTNKQKNQKQPHPIWWLPDL